VRVFKIFTRLTVHNLRDSSQLLQLLIAHHASLSTRQVTAVTSHHAEVTDIINDYRKQSVGRQAQYK